MTAAKTATLAEEQVRDPVPPRSRPRGRAAAGALVLLALGAAGGWAGMRLLGSGPARATRPTLAVGTAVVHRQDLTVSDLVDGELGYPPSAPVVNRLAGTYTALPAEGSVIRRGQALYQVDGSPVVLLYGRQPAWRAFALGMPDGPDVAELEANLVALGFAGGLELTPDGHFNHASTVAVERWQRALGLPQTGVIELGWAVFLPGPVRVGARQAGVGAIAAPGATPFTATSSTRVVSVALDAARQDEARPGARVTIDLPSGRTTSGTVTEVSRVASGAPAAGGSGSAGSGSGSGGDGGGSGGGAAGAQPTVTVTVRPDHPAATGQLDQEPVQVELVTDARRGVLAVPITALLALAEGGYGVEVVGASGAHRLVAVRTGLFASTMVEVSGPGIAEGTRVVTAQ